MNDMIKSMIGLYKTTEKVKPNEHVDIFRDILYAYFYVWVFLTNSFSYAVFKCIIIFSIYLLRQVENNNTDVHQIRYLLILYMNLVLCHVITSVYS